MQVVDLVPFSVYVHRYGIIHSYLFYYISAIDACQQSPCQNGGTCDSSGPGTFQCVCPPLWNNTLLFGFCVSGDLETFQCVSAIME